ncbi:MAG: GNAT family N-acetyltransferase [Rhodobiaceae bacterium]|nr:MAG: GNAT family N-acetyltransferase [Rhodobiaceae bacterium]
MIAETLSLDGEGLRLRPLVQEDAPRVYELASNWNVASMLARMPYPYTESSAEEWISGHVEGRASGNSWPFAIEVRSELVGATGLSRTDDGPYELGYWIGEPYWGQGIATKAARVIVKFAFDILGADRLISGHFTENSASGRVLTNIGFQKTGKESRFCVARGKNVDCIEFELHASEIF